MSVTTAQFAHEQGIRLLRSLAVRIARTLRTPGVDEVHDLRVAIRRAVRILVVLKPCFPRGESRRIRRALKRIMAQAGSVRDCDIAMRLLAKMALPGAGAAIEDFRRQRVDAAAVLTGSLARWKERNLIAVWRNALDEESGRLGAKAAEATARALLPGLAVEYFRHGREAVNEDASVDEIHEFRIAAKSLRYTLDLFAPLYGRSLNGLVADLKDVQALLGDINDCVTVRRMLARGKGADGKEIRAALRKRQNRKIDVFRQRYAATYSDASLLRKWKAGLRGTALG